MALKLDISKVYDRVSWEFLRHVMLEMGFENEWIELIMMCVSTVTHIVLKISHLFFADDNFLFFKATKDKSSTIKRVLLNYEMIFGQVVNFYKSGIFFSPNVDSSVKNTISAVLGVSSSIDTGRYLGLPSLIGKSKRTVFRFLKDRLWKCLQGWKNRFLSRAGKEVLIKLVAQSIPSYCMSTFLIPISLCEELKKKI